MMLGPQGFPQGMQQMQGMQGMQSMQGMQGVQGMMGPIMNQDQMNSPGLSDAPLEFNTNKNKPPMALTGKFTICLQC